MSDLKYVVWSPEYEVDIGLHPFVTSKFRVVKEKLIREKVIKEENIILAEPATERDILLVHTKEYYKKVRALKLSYSEIIRLEIPLTQRVVQASAICCGGTIRCCQLALQRGVGIHLGGGFHHAFPDHGEGFCIFNDLAIAIRKLLTEHKISRPMIIDCDLHQGNGTAFIFKNDKDVFTFSIHQQDIYPFPKQKSSLDVELTPGISDEAYNSLLEESLTEAFAKHKPDFVLYQAGADPYKDDQLGGLALTINGLKKRDEIVKRFCITNDLPVAITLGGGYAVNADDIVTIHTNTLKVFLDV